MNGSILRAALLVLVVAAGAVLYACTFVVSQTQSAIVLRLGAVRAVKTAPGLYLKWFAPIETVTLLDNRILSDSPVTLREIGAKYGITRERVRQIESRLLEKLKDHLSKRIEDFSSDWIHKDE